MDVLKTWFTPHKPPPPQGGCSPKIFLYIILAAKWLVRHSNTRTSPIFSSFYPSSMAHIDCATAYNKQSFSCLLQYNSSLLAGAQANERNVVFGLLHQTLFEVVGCGGDPPPSVCAEHRRRMETAAKATAVASVLGTKFIHSIPCRAS